MAKKSASVELLEGQTGDEGEDLSPEERDALEAMSDIDGAAQARWQVYRVKTFGDDKPPGFLGELSSAELRMSALQTRWGRGKYRLRGFRPDGSFLKGATVEVGDDPPQKTATSSALPAGDAMALFMEREEKRAERNRELMLAVVPGAITAVAGIFTAMMSRQQPPQQNILADIGALKSIIGPPPERESSTDLMIKMLELGKKYGDKGGGGDSWVDVVKEALAVAGPMLAEKLNSSGNTPAPNQPTVAQLPAPGAASTHTAQVQPTGDNVNALKMMQLANWAREKLTYLATKAAKNSDPEVYVDWIVDEIPDGIDIREFAQYLEHEQWWQYLQQFAPAVTPYQGWFSEFRDLLMDTVQEMFTNTEGAGKDGANSEPEQDAAHD